MTIGIGIQLETEILLASDSRVTYEPFDLFEDSGTKIEPTGKCPSIWTSDESIGPWAHYFATREKYETETMDLAAWNEFMAEFSLYLRDERGCNVARDGDLLPTLNASALIASPTQGLLMVEPCGFVKRVPLRRIELVGSASTLARGVVAALDFTDEPTVGQVAKNLVKTVELVCRHSSVCGMPCHLERIPLWGAYDSGDTLASPRRPAQRATPRQVRARQRPSPNPVAA